jgi:hypothetical protein
MKRLSLLSVILLVILSPLACTKTYTWNPVAPPTPTATPPPANPPTSTPTPCGGRIVSTLAGQAGVRGATNATGTAASFNLLFGVAVDASGNVYVADTFNNLIRMITSGGVVTTLAGQVGTPGATNATGTAASFNGPAGVVVDSSGNVYVADSTNDLIREISPGGVVTTLAGQAGVFGSTNATGTAASFNDPTGVAVDSSGNVYVADTANNMIRKIAPGGVVTTFAGQLTAGSTNATGTAASFKDPDGVAVDSSGNVYVADTGNYLIREISPSGVVTTLAGQAGVQGSANGTGTAASFNTPTGVAVDSSGDVYVADLLISHIREITPGGTVTTIAGLSLGSTNGSTCVATFDGPAGVAIDSTGNVYVADKSNDLIREITP